MSQHPMITRSRARALKKGVLPLVDLDQYFLYDKEYTLEEYLRILDEEYDYFMDNNKYLKILNPIGIGFVFNGEVSDHIPTPKRFSSIEEWLASHPTGVSLFKNYGVGYQKYEKIRIPSIVKQE